MDPGEVKGQLPGETLDNLLHKHRTFWPKKRTDIDISSILLLLPTTTIITMITTITITQKQQLYQMKAVPPGSVPIRSIDLRSAEADESKEEGVEVMSLNWWCRLKNKRSAGTPHDSVMPTLPPSSLQSWTTRLTEVIEGSIFHSTKHPEEATKRDSGLGQLHMIMLKWKRLSNTITRATGRKPACSGNIWLGTSCWELMNQSSTIEVSHETLQKLGQGVICLRGRPWLGNFSFFFFQPPIWCWTLLPTDAQWWHHSYESLLLST